MPPSPYLSRDGVGHLRIASNPWTENATLNALMDRWGLQGNFGLKAVEVSANGVAGPFEAICTGQADLCLVSGYNGLLPRIAAGAPVRIVGAGMRKAALTILARPDRIRCLADLEGRRIAVGPRLGLLHILMLQLFRENALDASSANFIAAGSNDQCYSAVVTGAADACCTSVSHLNDSDGLRPVDGGNIWQALPSYTFQTAYASTAALRDKRDALVLALAAQGALYDRLMRPCAREDYFAARASVEGQAGSRAAHATWAFLQAERPYRRDLTLGGAEVEYLQSMLGWFGLMRQAVPAACLVDMAPARTAASLPGGSCRT